MSFSADWLTLRAGFDSAARSTALEARLADWAAARVRRTGRPLRIVDLAAGTGNNRRHLSPRIAVPQHWTLVDNDPALLAAAGSAADIRVLDLAADPAAAIPDDTDLVTASALLDLVSSGWLDRLAARLQSTQAALFAVLSYDGRIEWQAPAPFDAEVRDLVNRHQRTDKGFGPALGPDAVAALVERLDGAPETAPSDWVMQPSDRAMRAAMVDGWAGAATEIAPELADRVAAWRRTAADRGGLLTVGHRDLLLLPER